MANANRPWGMKPIGYRDGSPWNGKATTYYIQSSDTNAYAVGDPVMLAGSGSSAGVPDVTLATAGAGNALIGCIVGTRGTVYGGVMADPASLDTMVIPATKTKGYFVQVADDPNIEFLMQESATTDAAALTVASLGSNIDLVSGTNNGFFSGWKIDSTTANTGATRQLKLMRLWQAPDNALGAYAKWVVFINNHAFNAGVAGV